MAICLVTAPVFILDKFWISSNAFNARTLSQNQGINFSILASFISLFFPTRFAIVDIALSLIVPSAFNTNPLTLLINWRSGQYFASKALSQGIFCPRTLSISALKPLIKRFHSSVASVPHEAKSSSLERKERAFFDDSVSQYSLT